MQQEYLLRVPQDVGKGVHSDIEVAGIDAHGLLAHGTLIRVARGLVSGMVTISKEIRFKGDRVKTDLVVIGIGNDGPANAQDHGGVDLHVCERAAVADVKNKTSVSTNRKRPRIEKNATQRKHA